MNLYYLYDPEVTISLDVELRSLLSLCFPDKVFHQQRFKYELPAHRWIIRNENEELVAHVALHDKRIGSEVGELRIAGVAEVCVHPDFRGLGLMRRALSEAHQWIQNRKIPFSCLFGLPELYKPYDYFRPENLLRRYDVDGGTWVVQPESYFLIRSFSDQHWPQGTIDLQGPKF